MSKQDQEGRHDIPAKQFAFPKQREEPLDDATYVRNAIACFNQVQDVTDSERDEAWAHICTTARKFGVEMDEANWRELKVGKQDKH